MEKQKIVDMDTGKKNALRTGQDRTGQDRTGQDRGIIRYQMAGGYETTNRVYSPKSISPCINARDYKGSPKVIKRWKKDLT